MHKKILKKIKFDKNNYVSEKSKVFIVAEISGNHSGKIQNVLKSIDKIKQAGADAVKIQSYEPNTITIFKEKILLKINQFGRDNIFMIYTNQVTHHFRGIRKFFLMLDQKNYYVFLAHLI